MRNYWDSFYKEAPSGLSYPSQFAVFVLSELQNCTTIIDIGCGNGRDSLFFASHGIDVVGVDGSTEAVNKSCVQAERLGLHNVSFIQKNISDTTLPGNLSTRLNDAQSCVYARFFLHAVSSAVEKAFLSLASSLTHAGGLVAVEFRTVRDAPQVKVTPEHYRRFINPVEFLSSANSAGLSLEYFVEGFGYAKYKSDDAHVARCLFREEGRIV